MSRNHQTDQPRYTPNANEISQDANREWPAPRPSVSLSLDVLNINEPCPADWSAMSSEGEARRFCDQCELHVHDLSAMPRVEAEALLESKASESNGPGEAPARLCVRYLKDADGRILTLEDQPAAKTSGDCGPSHPARTSGSGAGSSRRRHARRGHVMSGLAGSLTVIGGALMTLLSPAPESQGGLTGWLSDTLIGMKTVWQNHADSQNPPPRLMGRVIMGAVAEPVPLMGAVPMDVITPEPQPEAPEESPERDPNEGHHPVEVMGDISFDLSQVDQQPETLPATPAQSE